MESHVGLHVHTKLTHINWPWKLIQRKWIQSWRMRGAHVKIMGWVAATTTIEATWVVGLLSLQQ
jgi:hypothetical protein